MTTKWARAAVLRGIRTSPRGENDNDDHACEPNNITVQNKIIAKILPVNKFTTLKVLSLLPSMNGYFFSWLLCFALQYMFIQICSQTWASLSFVPPRWGANSSQSCRSCSFSGHKQRCSTVLSELRYKVAYNPNTFFPELETTYSRKSRWGCIAIHQNVCSRSLNQNCQGIF